MCHVNTSATHTVSMVRAPLPHPSYRRQFESFHLIECCHRGSSDTGIYL